jgi:hypothetical protein
VPEELLRETVPEELRLLEEVPLDTELPEELRPTAELPLERVVVPTEERDTLLTPDPEPLRTEDPAAYEDLPDAEDAAEAFVRGTCTEEERLAPMPLDEPEVAPPRVVNPPSLRPRASALEKPLWRVGPPYQ